ncbi:phospholipase D-like domain-containing protein [Rhodoferax antarcticus]|uniref:phospholipase D-like domain-containing protein n=1 Tax=Rhodoferax antarcticus TaxID=81479 RepID=UPI000958981F|nr:phospholipase D-like domain-containing protein [Rhodoferax antarcticus]APW48655.1 hypothetical protein RA876_19525 [Rhodoferax antarcticus]
MNLLDEFRRQVRGLGALKRAWFTTFNLSIPFFETHVLPVLLDADLPANRMDYENMQMQLAERGVDLRVFCDLRVMEADQLKRTAVAVHGVLPERLRVKENWFRKESLFHPKVIFLEDESGRMVLGAGSANLSISGWGRNQEVFVFRSISNNEQYRQVKRFFDPLLAAAGLGDALALGVRRRFKGNDEGWRFVHSFESQSFLQLLLADTQANRLTVWSPYFSRDLSRLLVRVQELAGRKLNFSIVPDRVGNRYVRTVWTDAIQKLLDDGVLSFHDRPSPRADEIEMTHAKLWLASGRRARLAVGSWNCTEPGAASFELRNVEAGILLDVPPKSQIAGQPLKIGEKEFGSEEMLEDDELDPPLYPLPFELQVSFDWKQGHYEVQGRLFDDIQHTNYRLRLPGVKKQVPLRWKKRRSDGAWPLESIKIEFFDNEALLADHCYEVWRDGNLEYRGLVQETGQDHRRAQSYDSLKDLLNDLINGITPGADGNQRLRKVLRHGDVPDDEPVPPPVGADGGGMSYFRLFHAFEQFRKRLRGVRSMGELEKLLFVSPGSLQEMIGKVNEQVAAPVGNTVFSWFLLQEADSLHTVALEAYANHRAKYAPTTPPENSKWASLRSNKRAVSLPQEVRGNTQYMRQLREVCGYGE